MKTPLNIEAFKALIDKYKAFNKNEYDNIVGSFVKLGAKTITPVAILHKYSGFGTVETCSLCIEASKLSGLESRQCINCCYYSVKPYKCCSNKSYMAFLSDVGTVYQTSKGISTIVPYATLKRKLRNHIRTMEKILQYNLETYYK